MATVRAQLNGLRIAPRKVRAVVNLVKGRDAIKALSQLEFFMRRPVPNLIKLLNSAIANAENNFHMVKDNLYIKDFIVDEGVKLKRMRPKGFGRPASIQKKTSRVTLVLAERVAGLKQDLPVGRQGRKTVEEKPHIHKEVKEEKQEMKKPEIKTEIGKKDRKPSFVKRIFQRKAI